MTAWLLAHSDQLIQGALAAWGAWGTYKQNVEKKKRQKAEKTASDLQRILDEAHRLQGLQSGLKS